MKKLRLKETEQMSKANQLFVEAQFPLMALEILAQLPTDGTEEEKLVTEFACSVDQVVGNESDQLRLIKALKEINPHYIPKIYSPDVKANILANVVAAIYAPLIHAFNLSVLKNIKKGTLSPIIIAPPRDAIPFANSIATLADIKNIPIKILQLPVTRKVAGISNSQGQNGKVNEPDPLLSEYLAQELGPYLKYGFTEIEPGIYSTTSMVIAEQARQLGSTRYASLKLYGLGPNLSFTHALLSGGKEWVAEKAELSGLVESNQVANLMTLLDSTEEFGMQNMHATVERLTRTVNGKIVPDIKPAGAEAFLIAQATNAAILDTAAFYANGDKALKVTLNIISHFDQVIELSQQGLPLSFTAPIPPGKIEGKKVHFDRIRTSGLLQHPKNLVL